MENIFTLYIGKNFMFCENQVEEDLLATSSTGSLSVFRKSTNFTFQRMDIFEGIF